MGKRRHYSYTNVAATERLEQQAREALHSPGLNRIVGATVDDVGDRSRPPSIVYMARGTVQKPSSRQTGEPGEPRNRTGQHSLGGSQVVFVEPGSWLQDFQHSDQAWQVRVGECGPLVIGVATCMADAAGVWQVADALLDDPDSRMEACFFAAETLYAKIKYDFTELPPAQ